MGNALNMDLAARFGGFVCISFIVVFSRLLPGFVDHMVKCPVESERRNRFSKAFFGNVRSVCAFSEVYFDGFLMNGTYVVTIPSIFVPERRIPSCRRRVIC